MWALNRLPILLVSDDFCGGVDVITAPPSANGPNLLRRRLTKKTDQQALLPPFRTPLWADLARKRADRQGEL